MNKRNILLFVAGLAALLALQIKFVLPLINEIAASDLFMVDSKDQASALPISNDMTAIAFSHCNTNIKNKLGEETVVTFANQPTNVWTIGNYEYIVNAEVEITPKEGVATNHHYACRIQYANGDDLSGAASIDNWNLQGLDGISE